MPIFTAVRRIGRACVLAAPFVAAGTAGLVASAVPGPGGAAVAQAGAVTLQNVTLDLGSIVYRIPKAELVGTSLSQAELAALFDKSAAEPLSARLARLSARQVTIPELVMTQRVGEGSRSTVYRDVVARDIVNGRFAALASAGARIEIAGRPTGTVAGTTGRTTIQDFDAAQAARVYEGKAAPGSVPMTRIYDSFALEDLAVSDPKGADVRVARLSGKDFSARPSRESWAETMRLLEQHGGTLDQAPPVDRARLLTAIADLFDSFAIGSVEAMGFEVRNPKEQGVARIARVGFTGASAGKPADARMEGLEVTADNGRAKIGTIAFTGFSFKPTLDGLKALSDKPLTNVDPEQLRALIPTIGSVRLSGLDFDVPNKDKPGRENIRFGIRDVEVTADKPLNGIPTNLVTALRNLTLSLPPDATEDGIRELVAMGYRSLDLSFLTSAGWNESGNELQLREISLSGLGMGSATLRGVLGNVTRDVFSPDSTVALVALVGATARSLELTVQNGGLVDRALAEAARKQGKSADDLRRELGVAAAVGIPAVLGGSPAAKNLGQAVARFIAKPGKLMVSAKAREPAGLGASDFALLADPQAIFDKLEVTATVE